MRSPVLTAIVFVLVLCGQEHVVWAGMPSVSLSDMGALRLQTISFFLFALLLSALGIQWLWNGLSRSFDRLPRMTYGKAVGATVLWGLLFIIVLTMISGARELMTPGAWEKTGATYQLKRDVPVVENTSLDLDRELRRRQAERLADGLARFSRQHDGRFPESMDNEAFDGSLWHVPVSGGGRYHLVTDLTTSDLNRIVAYEPAQCDQPLFAVTTGGRVQEVQWDDLRRELAEATP